MVDESLWLGCAGVAEGTCPLLGAVGARGGSQPAPVVLSGGHDVAVADFGVLLLCGALGGALSRGLGSGRAEISAPAADSPPINGGASGEKKRGGIKI